MTHRAVEVFRLLRCESRVWRDCATDRFDFGLRAATACAAGHNVATCGYREKILSGLSRPGGWWWGWVL